MQISLNGEPFELPAETTVKGLLALRQLDSRYLAVELNRQVVSRKQHDVVVLQEGDVGEVVTLVGGG